MFPLNLTLLPGSVLPLKLYESRYLQLYRDIVDRDREFGVVLIERGMDSGGNDARFRTGSVARMVGSAMHENGSVSIVTVGTQRVRVLEWMEDRPYPSARVELLSDDPMSEIGEEFVAEAREALVQVRALFSELGADVGLETPQLSDDPIAATYQMAQLGGLQSLDLQRVLEAPSSDLRAGLVKDLITNQADIVRMRLELG